MKVKIVACDDHQRQGEIRAAGGRVGVQLAGEKPRWRDLCGECLADTTRLMQPVTPLRGVAKARQNGKDSVLPFGKRCTGAAFEQLCAAVQQAMKKHPGLTAKALSVLVGARQSQTVRALGAIKARRVGERAQSQWFLPGQQPVMELRIERRHTRRKTA